VSNQTVTTESPAQPDPVRELENTRRTLLQIVANIDVALATIKESAKSR
jgi:hypothetical protein